MSLEGIRIVGLASGLDRAAFDCGISAMNEYLARYASQNEDNHLTRTRVALDPTGRIAGYYTTSFAQVQFDEIPVRGLPKKYPFTVGLLAQIAVDRAFQAQGLGTLILLDALARFERTDRLSAIPAVVLDLREPNLSGYYARFGFVHCGTVAVRMYLLMKNIAKLGLNPDLESTLPQ